MENRIAVYHRLYVLCMAGMLPGLLLSIFLYIRLDMYEVFGYFPANIRDSFCFLDWTGTDGSWGGGTDR